MKLKEKLAAIAEEKHKDDCEDKYACEYYSGFLAGWDAAREYLLQEHECYGIVEVREETVKNLGEEEVN